ncbi:MAG TPA: DUF1861 family protein [Bacillota bacterium]|nr:DUF1861 family protein [Bacillota bacterium]
MKQHDVWFARYGYVCPSPQGRIVTVEGVGRRDLYNVTMIEQDSNKILAFRSEQRRSLAWSRHRYHPVVRFARRVGEQWQVDNTLPPFDMMEDPFCFTITKHGKRELIFGGVIIRREGRAIIPQTVFYRGRSIFALNRTPFATIDNMKDIRLVQMPDGRLLLSRRPWGGEFGRGQITLHVLNSIEDLQAAYTELHTLAVLEDCAKTADWVGVNELHILPNADGEPQLCILGHLAFQEANGTRHYAACTYTNSLAELLNDTLNRPCPRVLAVRACFEPGPAKLKTLTDVVFPGHLEHLSGNDYRLWAGLSDARIGVVDLQDPFRLTN